MYELLHILHPVEGHCYDVEIDHHYMSATHGQKRDTAMDMQHAGCPASALFGVVVSQLMMMHLHDLLIDVKCWHSR